MLNGGEMMLVVLGDEVAEIDDGHGLLETGMEGSAGEFGGRHAGDFFHNGATRGAEVGEDVGDRARVMGGFVGFAVLEVGGMQRFGAAGVIVEALVP